MDYTKHDYNTLVTDLTARFSEVEGWGDAYQTTTGQRLIQLFADTTDSLMYMLERRSQEAFISTAVLKRSVIAHASEVGYRTRRTVSMTGTLTLTLTENGSPITIADDVVIPKHTTITSKNPTVQFVTTVDATIPAGQSSTTVQIKEGILRSVTIDTTSDYFAEFHDHVITEYDTIDEYSIEIDDSGEKYYDVEDSTAFNIGTLAYATATDPVYDVRYGVEGMRIVFGDGLFGKKPSGVLTLTYIESQQVVNAFNRLGSEFALPESTVRSVSTSLPVERYSYTLVNSTAIRGYTPVEGIGLIASNATESLRANNRSVSNPDFEYWGVRSGIGGVVDVNSYGEQEAGSLIFNMNNVYMSYVTSDNQPFTSDQLTQFRAYLARLSVATVHTVVKPAEIITAVCRVTLQKDTRVPLASADVYKTVRTAMSNYFAPVKGSIGKSLQHSELVKHLQDYKVTVNSITYSLTDFVKVDITAQYPLPNPVGVFDVRVFLSTAYTLVVGNVWRIDINGTPISVTVTSGDTRAALLEKMRVAISNSGLALTTTETVAGVSNLRLRSPYIDSFITVDVSNGTLAPHTTTDTIIRIPSDSLNLTGSTDRVVRGSVTIVDQNQAIVFQDNGSGSLVRVGGGSAIPIDYTKFELMDYYHVNPANDYFIRYQQNVFQNINVDSRSVVNLSPIASTIDDSPLYSTIDII